MDKVSFGAPISIGLALTHRRIWPKSGCPKPIEIGAPTLSMALAFAPAAFAGSSAAVGWNPASQQRHARYVEPDGAAGHASQALSRVAAAATAQVPVALLTGATRLILFVNPAKTEGYGNSPAGLEREPRSLRLCPPP